MAAADIACLLPMHFDQATVIAPADAVQLTSGYRMLVATNQHGAGSDASLTLSDADGHTILWSKSWSGDRDAGADLGQQVSRSASQAALCLAEAKTGKQRLIQPALESSSAAASALMIQIGPTPNCSRHLSEW